MYWPINTHSIVCHLFCLRKKKGLEEIPDLLEAIPCFLDSKGLCVCIFFFLLSFTQWQQHLQLAPSCMKRHYMNVLMTSLTFLFQQPIHTQGVHFLYRSIFNCRNYNSRDFYHQESIPVSHDASSFGKLKDFQKEFSLQNQSEIQKQPSLVSKSCLNSFSKILFKVCYSKGIWRGRVETV